MIAGGGGGDSRSRAYPLAQTALNLIAWALAVAATATPYATHVTATSTIDINFFEWCVTSSTSSSGNRKTCQAIELDTFPCEGTFTMHEVGRAMGVLACIALGIGWILGIVRFFVKGSSRATPRQIQEWLMRGAVPCCAIAFVMTMLLLFLEDCNKLSFLASTYDLDKSGPLFVAAAWFAIIGSSIRMCSCCTDDEVEDDANNNDNNNDNSNNAAAPAGGGGASLRMQVIAPDAAPPPVTGVQVAPPPAGYETTNLAFGVPPPPPGVGGAPDVPAGFAAPPPSGPNFFGGPPPSGY